MVCTRCGKAAEPLHTRSYFGAKMAADRTYSDVREFSVSLCDPCLDREDRKVGERWGAALVGCFYVVFTAGYVAVALSPEAEPGIKTLAWGIVASAWLVPLAFAIYGRIRPSKAARIRPRPLSALDEFARARREALGVDKVFTAREWEKLNASA